MHTPVHANTHATSTSNLSWHAFSLPENKVHFCDSDWSHCFSVWILQMIFLNFSQSCKQNKANNKMQLILAKNRQLKQEQMV